MSKPKVICKDFPGAVEQRHTFCNFQVFVVRSMMEMVNASITPEQLDDLVDSIMKSHGISNKQVLTLEDFQKTMANYNTELSDATLLTPGINCNVNFVISQSL